jgi:hypothetical protein
VVRTGELQNAVADAANRLAATRREVNAALAKLDARDRERERAGGAKGPDEAGKALRQSARDLQKKISAVERRLLVSSEQKGLMEDPWTVVNYVDRARRAIGTSWQNPNATATAYMEQAEAVARPVLADVNKLYAEDVPAFQKKLADAKIEVLTIPAPVELK